MKVAVTCGGTGGHTYPGLATAVELKRRGHAVTLWLGGRAVETTAVTGWEGPVVRIPARGLQGGVWRSLGALLGVLRAVACSHAILRRERPDVLLAMGSYASMGPALAAWMLRIPVVLHEANAIPGRAITVLSRFARVVAIAFHGAAAYFRACPTVMTGLPLRQSLQSEPPAAAPPAVFTLLVMGGSQGARALNGLVPAAVGRLAARGLPVHVVHLAGAGHADAVTAAYREVGVEAEVLAYAHDMVAIYRRVTFAIARSGAGACAELGHFCIPALFVPLPGSIRDHQNANAMDAAATGGADVMAQSALTPEGLADYIAPLLQAPGRLSTMRRALAALATVDGAAGLAALVESQVDRAARRGGR